LGGTAAAGTRFESDRDRFVHKPPAAIHVAPGAAQCGALHHLFGPPRAICVNCPRQRLPNASLCRMGSDAGYLTDEEHAHARLPSFVSLKPNVLSTGYEFETDRAAFS